MNLSGRPKIVAILGPTGIGKSACAMEICRRFGGEIISADSRQFYRNISIGTAKPSAEERQEVPHHFVDFLGLDDSYTAGQFERDALEGIAALHAKRVLPVVVGGSGLYIKALLEGLDGTSVKEAVRSEILKIYDNGGLETLQIELKKRDPEYFRKVDQKNHVRLIRALELIVTTGKTMDLIHLRKAQPRPFDTIKIELTLDRSTLYARVNERVDKMIADGLVEEARKVADFRDKQALQTVGYKELFDYFDGVTDLAEAVRLIKQNSRRYAKRQLTWLRKEADFSQFTAGETMQIATFIEQQLER